jgi:chaperonin cofactor prefoldin
MEEEQKIKETGIPAECDNIPQKINKESDEDWFKNWSPDNTSELQGVAERLENEMAEATKDMLRANRKIKTLQAKLNIVLDLIK